MKKLILSVITIFFGLLIGLLSVEAAIRIFHMEPERYSPPRWFVKHKGEFKEFGKWGRGLIKRESRYKRLGVTMGEYVPGVVFKVRYATNPRGYFDKDNELTYKINSIGVRGPETTWKKPRDVIRILGIGDSFTFGDGVKERDTFLRRLEVKFNSRKGNKKYRYEVINAGVQGYNTRDEVTYLENLWLRLHPSLVIISFYINDAYNDRAILNMGELQGIYNKPKGLARYSKLVDIIQHRLELKKITDAMKKYYSNQYFLDPSNAFRNIGKFEIDWIESKKALQRLAWLSKRYRFKLALVMFPELHHLDNSYPFKAIHKLVSSTCNEFGIPMLDMLNSYKGMKDRDLWVHPSDHHPNEIGHDIASKAIYDFLYKKVL